MPLKIAIDGRCLTDHYPGIGRYVFNLLLSLPDIAEDSELSVFTAEGDGNSRFDLEALVSRGVRLIPTRAAIRGMQQQHELPRRLRQIEAEVFHAPYFLTTYRSPCPMVVGLYDTIPTRFPETLPSVAARVTARLGIHMALRSAQSVIVLSRFAKDDLVKTYGLASDRIVVTPGAPAEGYQPASTEAIAELGSRLGLPERYVLHVGTNKPHKNLEKLLEAWGELKSAGKAECDLVLAGAHDPRYFQVAQAVRSSGLKGVRCLGPVAEDDLPVLYSGAELFVFPSLYEGFGLPVLEAMACGTAVACSKSSSLPEVAGHAAAYFDAEDVASITQTLARLLKNSNYSRVLAERGRARAAQLTWKQTARATVDVYRRAIRPQ